MGIRQEEEDLHLRTLQNHQLRLMSKETVGDLDFGVVWQREQLRITYFDLGRTRLLGSHLLLAGETQWEGQQVE